MLLNKLIQFSQMHDVRRNEAGTIAVSSLGIIAVLHQQALLLFTMQLFMPLQKGHNTGFTEFCIAISLGLNKIGVQQS